ncbi:protein O-mannosyl-transferase TMTC1-like isoform X1 [Mya arenaria]|uniref:protein O-mannosyl-transferase TMTC1-like isoform X1 n=1 Tax=Mya arenaria TaxID=6604 RepID=UPI0022E3B46F|nr:protein O-mannosyl-transferase TMTC1-like isoform X1 [Mya arenaria]
MEVHVKHHSDRNNNIRLNNKHASFCGSVIQFNWKEMGLLCIQNWKCMLPPLLALLCYVNGLNGEFVHDDVFAIKRNPDVSGATSLGDVFQNDFWGRRISLNTSHKSYRPLTVLTFRLNRRLLGPDPFYFHVVNVFLHVLVTSMFVRTCRDVLHVGRTCSALAGCLFAVHPVHAEAVTGIVGRADVLAAAFFLLALGLYTRTAAFSPCSPSGMASLAGALVCAMAAMLSKETGATVLGTMVVYELHRHYTRKTDKTDTFIRLTSVLIFTVVLLCARVNLMGGTLPAFTPHDNPAAFATSMLTRWFTHAHIWTYNMWLLLAPARLCYDWQHGSIPIVHALTDMRNLVTVAMATIGCYLGYKLLVSFTKERRLLWSVVLLLLPLFPASNILFTVGFVLAERVLYIPSFGFCLLVSTGVCHVCREWRHYRRHVITCFWLLILLHAAKTFTQNQIWKDRETLFRSGLAAMPHNAKVHYNYGNFLKDAGRRDEAIQHYREAIRLDPTYASALNNLGVHLQDRQEAEIHFREAIRILPSHQGAHINLGNILFKRGEREAGFRLLERAVELGPGNPDALTSLGYSLMELGRLQEAEHSLDAALHISPDFREALLNYGALMNKMDNHEASARLYMRAHSLEPGDPGTLVSAASALHKSGDKAGAEAALKQALSIRRDAATLEQLAVLYYGTGRTTDALTLYKNVARMGSEASVDAMLRYAKILASEEQLVEAERILTDLVVQLPKNVEVLDTAAKVQSRLGKYQEGLSLFTRAINLTRGGAEGDLGDMLYNRGTNFKDLKQFKQALRDFESVLRITPDHVSSLGNIGAIYHMNAVMQTSMGDLKKARRHYERALALEPGNSIIRDNVEKLARLENHRVDGAH